MWLLYDNYVITMWFISLAYPFGIASITLRSGIGVVSGITSMIYTLSCILYVLSENTFSVPSKSSQESILTSFLPENQYVILNYITVGNVVLSVWNRQNRQFRHMSFLYSREVSAVFSFHLSVFRFTKERLNTSIDTSKKNIKTHPANALK